MGRFSRAGCQAETWRGWSRNWRSGRGWMPRNMPGIRCGRASYECGACRGVGAVDHEPDRAPVGSDGAPVHPRGDPAGLVCELVLPEYARFGEQGKAVPQLPELIRGERVVKVLGRGTTGHTRKRISFSSFVRHAFVSALRGEKLGHAPSRGTIDTPCCLKPYKSDFELDSNSVTLILNAVRRMFPVAGGS